MLAEAQPWVFQLHLEVWFLVAAFVGLGIYASRRIAPQLSSARITRRQKIFFWSGALVLWLASDWPMHDIAEEYLYSVHMLQHMLLTFVFPPLVLLSVPTWLARLVVSEGSGVYTWLKRFTHPVVAGLVFNGLTALTHWALVVNLAVENGPLHYTIHLAMVIAAFLMWMPVCGPFEEMRISLPGQMVYLFLMSILPTIPAAWLTFAENPLYSAYEEAPRLWNVTAAHDQQWAGLIMKLGGGMYLWAIITYLFFVWAMRHEQAERAGVVVGERDVLTWDEVQETFDRLGPGPSEPAVGSAPDRGDG
ncbi:MAG: cytochrome c oxidase assembly protein [Actinomycetota bacterium]|nr:cytochrome c oxidase assembly protein [Actinomycetota bacterium]